MLSCHLTDSHTDVSLHFDTMELAGMYLAPCSLYQAATHQHNGVEQGTVALVGCQVPM